MADSGVRTRRDTGAAKIIEANAMVPEINAPAVMLKRRINEVAFIYNLEA